MKTYVVLKNNENFWGKKDLVYSGVDEVFAYAVLNQSKLNELFIWEDECEIHYVRHDYEESYQYIKGKKQKKVIRKEF